MSNVYVVCNVEEGILNALEKAGKYINFSDSIGRVLSVRCMKSDDKFYYTVCKMLPSVTRVVTKYNIDDCISLREDPVEIANLYSDIVRVIKEKGELSLFDVMLDSDIERGLSALLRTGDFLIGLMPKGTKQDSDKKIVLLSNLVGEPNDDIDKYLKAD